MGSMNEAFADYPHRFVSECVKGCGEEKHSRNIFDSYLETSMGSDLNLQAELIDLCFSPYQNITLL